jgi:hypothetical protein
MRSRECFPARNLQKNPEAAGEKIGQALQESYAGNCLSLPAVFSAVTSTPSRYLWR